MKNWCLLFISFFCTSAYAGVIDDSYVVRGDRQMKNFYFERAAELYKTAADRDTNDIPAWEKLGNALFILNDYQAAEPVYKLLSIHALAKPIDKFYYGQVLRALGKYDEAQQAYTDFLKVAPDDSRAEEFRNFSDAVKKYIEDSRLYQLSQFSENTSASEMGAAFCNDKIIFSTNRGDGIPIKHTDIANFKPFYDIYEMQVNDSTGDTVLMKMQGKVNRKFNEGPATFSNDGKEMIFSGTHYITKGTDHISKLGLYHADYNKEKGWINIRQMPFNSYTYNVAHPSLSRDGKKLYFISDMPGGFGETDIYVSEKTDTAWATPVNLGKTINTPGREMFPFIEDNNKLFFSTDSRVGLGGLDIYSAFLSNDNWIYLTNLGAPVNTTADDYGYVTDNSGKKGFIVSNRAGGKGSDDIYNFVRKDEFVFSLPNVYFDSVSYNLREHAKVILDTIVSVLKKYPTMVMEVAGYTDSKGDFEFNLYLSQLRANACENYLVEHGISTSRLLSLGYGEWKLVNHCANNVPCTDEEHALNRRVEFKVIKIH